MVIRRSQWQYPSIRIYFARLWGAMFSYRKHETKISFNRKSTFIINIPSRMHSRSVSDYPDLSREDESSLEEGDNPSRSSALADLPYESWISEPPPRDPESISAHAETVRLSSPEVLAWACPLSNPPLSLK